MGKRFVAIQIGAQRSYAAPAALEQTGMLEAFYTDMCGNAGLGGAIVKLCPNFLSRGAVKNLAGRLLPENLRRSPKTHSLAMPNLRHLWQQWLSRNERDPEKLAKVWKIFADELGKEAVNRGIGQATHLFTCMGECMPLLEYAKQKGLTTFTEIFIVPSAHRICIDEMEHFFGLDLEQYRENPSFSKWFDRVLGLTDWAIAPSENVRQDLAENFNFSADRCFVVPYAVDDSWFEVTNRPVKGRVLFVGSAELRKGIYYLGLAAEKLADRGYEFRVAGGVSDDVRQYASNQKLNFLGRVPRLDIKQEYAQADIFVLPSLAEGSASVVYEALASGLPVITTKSSGSVVRHNMDGFIIPERDPESIADRIVELVENRDLRDRMAISAKARAKDYTWDKYSERLLAAFQSV